MPRVQVHLCLLKRLSAIAATRVLVTARHGKIPSYNRRPPHHRATMHCPPSLLTNTLNANRHMGGSSLTITYLFNKFAWMIRIKRSTCIAVVGFLLDPVVAPIHLLHKLSGKHPMSAHCAAPSVLHAANAPSQTLSPLAEHPPGVPKHGAAAAHALHGPSKAGGAAAAGCSSSAHVSGTQWVGKVSFEMLSTRHGPPVSRSTMNGNLAGFVLRQPTGALP